MINDQTLSCGHPIGCVSEMLPDFFGDTPATQKIGTAYCLWCADLANLLDARKVINRLNDDALAVKVAGNCHDKDHDPRWCPTCENRDAGIDEYRMAVRAPGGGEDE